MTRTSPPSVLGWVRQVVTTGAGGPRAGGLWTTAWVRGGYIAVAGLLAAAALTVLFTDAQGLFPVLALLAASVTSRRAGPWPAVLVTVGAAALFVLVLTAKGGTSGPGLLLTALAGLLWGVLAWSAGRVAEERQRMAGELDSVVEELHQRALLDPLTGLANRDLLLDRLGHALHRVDRYGGRVAVLFLDLDDFKLINDSLGHEVGDQLLVQFSRRLTAQLRETDTCARLGGDEFVLVCEDLHDDQEAVRIADRIITGLQTPFRIGDRDVTVGASIGIAVPSSIVAAAPQTLLQAADQAMYRAKERGGSRFDVYNEVLRERAVHRLTTENELRQAVERDELELVYQPIIALDDGRLTGVEALLRWNHPSRGQLPPGQFLPIAENSTVMVALGTWVLQAALAESVRWNRMRPQAPLTVAVNVSLRQLLDDSFDTALERALAATGADPATVHLEITETVLANSTPSMKNQLARAAERGVEIGLDDFGTGYSSLTLLKEFPVHFLKIDRSFVNGLGTDRDDTAITDAVIALSQTLELDAVAEGIETPEQLAHLREHGCRFGQGYHLGRPQPAARIDELVIAVH
jgi:diguanylate cyclase (GGDEF)-like protein